MKTIFITVVTVLTAALLSCDDSSDDNVQPEIVRFELSADTLAAGADELSVTIQVTDNAELGQMRFRIREAFAKSFGHWEEVRVEDLSGVSHIGTYSFPVPDTALAGLYEISFQAVDIRGNASIDSVQSLLILQSGLQPVFSGLTTVPAPDVSGEVTLAPDDALLFIGSVGDETGLAEVAFEFRAEDESMVTQLNYLFTDTFITLWDAASADTVFFEQFSVKPSAIRVKAVNTEGHQSRKSFQLRFFP